MVGLWLAGAAIAFGAVVIAATFYGLRKPLLFLVGVTGGLEHAQVHKVHLFVFAVFLLMLSGRRKDGHALTRYAVIIPVATAILCVSVPLGSLVNSRLFALQLLLLSLVAAALVVTLRPGEVRTVLSGLLAVISVGSTVAVMQYAHLLPLVLFRGAPRPMGIYSEPDWLALFAALGIVLAARAPLGNRVRFCLISLNGAACAVAVARGAWLALIVVFAFNAVASLVVRNNPDKQPGTGRLIGVFLVAGVLILSLNGSLRQTIVARVQGATQSSSLDNTAQDRLVQTRALLSLAQKEPWHGFGLSAEGRVQPFGQIQYAGTSANNVTSDWILGWWVDGGYLALPLIALFLYAAIRRLPRTPSLLLLLVLTNGFFSNATPLPITWLTLALVMSLSQAANCQETSPIVSVPNGKRLAVSGAM